MLTTVIFTSPKIAWALNKGIKPDYKQYWDVELGVTYIPWDKVKPEDLESFCEGGMLDNETLSLGTVFPMFSSVTEPLFQGLAILSSLLS